MHFFRHVITVIWEQFSVLTFISIQNFSLLYTSKKKSFTNEVKKNKTKLKKTRTAIIFLIPILIFLFIFCFKNKKSMLFLKKIKQMIFKQ